MELTTGKMTLQFSQEVGKLRLSGWDTPAIRGFTPSESSGLFTVWVDGKPLQAQDFILSALEVEQPAPGVKRLRVVFKADGLELTQFWAAYAETTLIESWFALQNTGRKPLSVGRVDTLSLDFFPETEVEILSFTGDWGNEFEPVRRRLEGTMTLQSRSGRSSKGNHPWFALFPAGGGVVCGSVAWSGNWAMRFEPLSGGGVRFSGGLNDWEFSKTLGPEEKIETPTVILSLGKNLNEASRWFHRVGRQYWYPRNDLSNRQPVEWNHWWPYEDVEINEEVFLRNIQEAARMGVEVCTLDAGWFGPSDRGSEWYAYRGDWYWVNRERFPRGIRPLADATHALGMKFGLWCEIEGLGAKAQLAQEHPDFVATRGGERLGYVCFGNPAVQEWAYQILRRLIVEYDCDWIKLDFNLDPGAGCDRTDHGHGSGDGLYEHYRGYYRTLERLRHDYPHVALENCSSGGLRIDSGMMRHTDMTFLSDPDWPVHDLQIFWGASTILAPDTLLHWSFCEWRNTNPPPQQNFNPRDPNLTREKLDYYTRISMLGLFGYSQKLPDLPPWVAERLAYHTRVYKEHIRRFVSQADFYRLTDQPRRDGSGDRWCAFQYHLPETEEHLLFVFRLPGGEAARSIRLEALQPGRSYRVQGLEGEVDGDFFGEELMKAGLRFDQLPEEGSMVLLIR